jgi:hypothetical protein
MRREGRWGHLRMKLQENIDEASITVVPVWFTRNFHFFSWFINSCMHFDTDGVYRSRQRSNNIFSKRYVKYWWAHVRLHWLLFAFRSGVDLILVRVHLSYSYNNLENIFCLSEHFFGYFFGSETCLRYYASGVELMCLEVKELISVKDNLVSAGSLTV